MKTLVFLLLPLFTLSEVLNDFTQCSQYFLDDTAPVFKAPTGVSVKHICQCLWDEDDNKKFLYATLYSTTWKIPIYSAYWFGKESTGRCDVWYIEPQLDGENEPCMRPKGSKIKNNQAVSSDYKNSGYDKGHVYPVMHTYNHLAMLATSTLTNAAPQKSKFNKEDWKEHEKAVIKDLASCKKAYVVAGVAPDTTAAKVNNKITVSKFFWRATCCLNSNDVYIGKAYFGPNNNDKVEEKTVQELETLLKSYYEIKIFPSIPKKSKIPRNANPCN
ncbi:endonuclease domain-containing 1 protein precursor [Danio rerio]|uniref:Endonuclease domain-containing 1 protein precursor n=1 Tax=Danio rerio TaxID=7955 RepID=A0AB13AB15_DANRE|nr:endonuclease domain-containing 1 protein precursor [Danio rerio]|eukprot:XP_009291437.1 endonuclease domain-containing 1 protein [Danio rerio]